MGKHFCRIIGYLRNDTTINVEKRRVATLLSHAKGEKHKSMVDCFSPVSRLYFQGNTSTTSEAPSARKSTSTFDNFIVPVSAAKAEIRWVLKVVDSNFSLRSCLDLNDLFWVTFPDSTTAKNFQLSKTKFGYCINFGVASYFRKLLKEAIEISPFLTILFAESLNGYVQKEQMDIKIRFWCDDKCKVTIRYFDSKFLAHGNVETISSALIGTLDGLDHRYCLMLSIDRPNTNWSVLDKVSSHRQ